MKPFFLKLIIVSVPVALLLVILLFSADGYSDPFYMRFTTPKQSSLILGTSRASQGILPQVIDSCLRRKDLFNYSFTRNTSPYGPVYLESIRKKLDTNTKNGIFILVVDAWGLSSDTANPNDIGNFEELKLCLAKTENVNANPNISYLLNSYPEPYIKLLRKNKATFLHDNGWLEVSVDMNAIDQKENIKAKMEFYRNETLPYYKYSPARYRYFIETIRYLKQYGKVYLVRLPVHPQMMQIDQELVPDLDKLVHAASIRCQVPYLNMSAENSVYQYTDGNHLYKDSAKKVTLEIAHWMLKQSGSHQINHNG